MSQICDICDMIGRRNMEPMEGLARNEAAGWSRIALTEWYRGTSGFENGSYGTTDGDLNGHHGKTSGTICPKGTE